jgi:hypothetical protein
MSTGRCVYMWHEEMDEVYGGVARDPMLLLSSSTVQESLCQSHSVRVCVQESTHARYLKQEFALLQALRIIWASV